MSVLTGTDFFLPRQTDIYRGKAHDVYTIDNDTVISISTDRISAFGVVLPQAIPNKGYVVNAVSAHFLRSSSDIVQNWLQDVPDVNVSVGYKCDPFKIEMVIRGYMVGHLWRVYEQGVREICGVSLPDGLQEYDALKEPIITPQTNIRTGHDEDLSALEIIENGYAREDEFERLSIITRQLFIRGRQELREKGIILADTKYRFGKRNGEIYLIDELHTPDSSRFFYADEYESFIKDRQNPAPRNMSKEFIRQWLFEHNFSGLPKQTPPEMGGDIISEIATIYIEIYEQILAKPFVAPDSSLDIRSRIHESIYQTLGQPLAS